MSTIVLIRPGCTDFDEQQRIQGSLDLPLNARGQRQIQQTVEELRYVPLEIIYASSCEPACSAAALIGSKLEIQVKECDGLRNIAQGLWEGLQLEEIRRKQPKVFKQLQESPETICPPGGEMLADAVDRIRKALEKPLKKKVNFAIVASEPLASVIRCIIRGCRLESFPPIAAVTEGPMWEFLSTNGHTPPEGLFTPQQRVTQPAVKGLERVEVATRGGSRDEFGPEN